jgi:hypothetical protein
MSDKKYIEESSVYAVLHDYVYDPDNCNYFAHIVNDTQIDFIGKYDALTTPIITIIKRPGDESAWLVNCIIYGDNGAPIFNKTYTDLDEGTLVLIHAIFGDINIAKKRYTIKDDYEAVVECLGADSDAYVIIVTENKDKGTYPLKVFDLCNCVSFEDLCQNYTNIPFAILQMVWEWANENAPNTTISNRILINYVADWCVYQQINS